jgi:cation:H+ antiporter
VRVVLGNLGLLLLGLVALVVGARWLVDGAVQLALGLGVDDVVIGLTIIAAGTSLPEVATSVIATLRRERDIAIGNAVGSNIFNLPAIAGISSLVTPGGLTVAPNVLAFDLPFMVAVAVACLPVFFNGYSLVRWEGGLFFASYVAYVTLLVLAATGNPALETFRHALLLAAPLVLLTLGWTTLQAWRRQRAVVA